MTQAPKRLRIFGAGRRAQVVIDQLAWHFRDDYLLEGFYDDNKPAGGAGPGELPILGTIADGCAELPGSGVLAFLALGTYRSWRACEVFAKLWSQGVSFARLVASTAHVSPTAVIGENALVMAGVFIGAEVAIGHLFTAHGGAVVEHHGIIGNNVLLGPGTTLAGLCRVEDHCFLGTGTSVMPSVRIGPGTMTGAGSVVLADLPAGVIAFGAPATSRRAVGDNDEVPAPAIIDRLPPLFAR
jgi:sugar O-acyltransferase (sialic acid O-acetyltransferase NeuD family)